MKMKGGMNVNPLRRWTLILLAMILLVTPVIHAAPSDLVYLVKVDGEIDAGLAQYIDKMLDEAEQVGARAVILEINTFGGFVDSGVAIRDRLLDATVETVAYIKDRAWSAGALIALACDKIYMTPESSMGAAETVPNEEKYVSAFRKEFKATAERQGRNPDIAAAMVDKDIEIPGVIEQGKLLTLTASEAVELKMADGESTTLKSVLKALNAEDGTVRTTEMSPVDRFARIITNPYMGALLIAIGFIGIVIEAMTLGWGVGGTIGVLALAVFFSGNLLVGNTNWGLILLFAAGMVLLGVELILIPGFGVTGVTGIGLILTSLFLTFDNAVAGMYAISFALILTIIAVIIMLRFFGKSQAWHRIALQTTQTKEGGYIAPVVRHELMGKEGTAITTLRPTGTALIDGERVDVVSEGAYINQGNKIKIIKVEGTRVVVREIYE